MEIEALNFWTERMTSDPRRANYEMIRITLPAYFYDRRNAIKSLEGITEKSYNHVISDLLLMDLMKNKYDLQPKLKDFKSPVLIIIGRQDIVGETTAYKIHNTLPNSELVFVEECGHFPWIEQPDIFYRTVEGFLRLSNQKAE